MKKIFLASIIVFMLGCSSPTQTPTISPSATHTIIPISTSTPKPATPTVTPFPPLQTNGPYFSYFRKIGEEYQLVMLDADGRGRREISFPNELIESLNNVPDIYSISPDGNWFAFHTGSAGIFDPDLLQVEGTFDLTLNVFNISTGEWQIITPLLSKEYPNNFKEASDELNDSSITSNKLYYSFLYGVNHERSFVWSPDGKYLAFAGQMDGLSSDIYIYHVETKSIQRLSSETQEITSIRWSPDSKWIVYHGAHEILKVDTKFDVFAVSIDGSTQAKQISTTTSGFPIWVNSHSYIEFDNDYELATSFGLRLVDIETGRIRKLWDGPVNDFGFNSKNNKFVFTTHLFANSPSISKEFDPNFVPEIYLVDLATFKITNIKVPEDFDFLDYSFIRSFNFSNNLFVTIGRLDNQSPYVLSKEGELTEIKINKVYEISDSPDLNYWVAIKDESIDIYTANNVLTRSVQLPFQDAPAALFIWKPDSKGLFVVQEFNIYSIDILNGEIVLLESNLLRRVFSFGILLITEK